jgi:hypothetical protein
MFDSNRMSRSGAKTIGRGMSVKLGKRQRRTGLGDEGRPGEGECEAKRGRDMYLSPREQVMLTSVPSCDRAGRRF